MSDRQALVAALQRSDPESLREVFSRLTRIASGRHALRIDATRYAAQKVRSDDGGPSGLALIGYSHGLLLADRLSGPLAPFTRPAAAQQASLMSLWCLRGPAPARPEIPEMFLVGDLPQDPYALGSALLTFVREQDAVQAAEVVARLLDRGVDRSRLVSLLARAVTEVSTDYRPFLLLSSALQLSARLGGDEVDNLLHAVVRGVIAVQKRVLPGDMPPRAVLPPDLDEELATLLSYQVSATGVADLRRLRARVREGDADAGWRAVLKALRDKVSWERIVDALSLEAALRLQTVRAGQMEIGTPLGQALEAMTQVHAVRWMMHHTPSPGALKALLELGSQLGWLGFAVETPAPPEAMAEQRATPLLAGLKDAFKARALAQVNATVARYRELNLPREGLAGALAEEAARGAPTAPGLALRLMAAESALAEAQCLYGSMEEGAYFQGLARVLALLPGDEAL